MVPLIEYSTHPIFGKTGQLQIKKEEWNKERKIKCHKSFFVDLTSIIQIIKYA